MGSESGALLSRYRILAEVGRGGMGIVFRAVDARLGRAVAIKVLRPDRAGAEEDRRRLVREARTAAALNHPNICIVHEVGEVGPDDPPGTGPGLDLAPGSPFLVMEWIDGETLRDRLDRTGSLPLHDLVEVAAQVAAGLGAAHAAGIVHRDLKPQNVALGPGGRWKILDFGLATPARREPRASGEDDPTVSVRVPVEAVIAGTVAYMSPEQALGRDLDRRSDLFSFGTMLYEMATGRKPFRGGSVAETVAKILEAEPEPPSRAKPDLPAALDAVVARCLRKDPAARFAGAGDVERALAALRDAPTPAAPGASEPSAEAVAVLPFAVRGGGAFAYLGEGMVDLLGNKLDGAGDLRSVDAHVLLCCLPERRGEEMDPGEARRIAHRFGAGLFVLGDIVEAGGSLSLTAALYDGMGEPKVVSRATVQGKAAEIFDLVDRLTAALVAHRRDGPDARLTRIAATTTDSFPALKAYLEGERHMRSMRREPAAEAFRRAVQADSRFALAWYRLSVASLWSSQPQEAWEAARGALRHAERLAPRDRRLLEAFDALLRGANDEAERLYRSIVGAWPDDVEAWFQLGEIAFHHGPARGRTMCESRPLWDRVLALDPAHLSALVHLVAIVAAEGDRAQVEQLSRRALELAGDADAAHQVRALVRQHSGDPREIERALDDLRRASDLSLTWTIRFLGVFLGDLEAARPFVDLLVEPMRSDEARTLGHLYRASLEFAAGRWSAARRELDAAASLDPAYALEHRALLAAHPLSPAPAEELQEIRAALLRSGPAEPRPPAARSLWLTPHEGLHAPLRAYLAGLLAGRLRDPDGALPFARELERWTGAETARPVVDGLAASLRARAAWEAGQAQEALDLLERATMKICLYFTLWSPFLAQDLERFQRAEWLREAGRLEEALPWYATFGENNLFDQVHLGPSNLRRGQIYEQLGRPLRAAKHYARFVERWKNCEPELRPLADEAEARLRLLRARADA